VPSSEKFFFGGRPLTQKYGEMSAASMLHGHFMTKSNVRTGSVIDCGFAKRGRRREHTVVTYG
jgi:hypothetical protein